MLEIAGAKGSLVRATKRRVKRRMTSKEFESVRPLLNMSLNRIEAARMALVDGEPLRVPAERFGWTRQAVDDAVGVVWRKWLEESFRRKGRMSRKPSLSLPPGWEQVTLVAPSYMIVRFRQEVVQEAARLRQEIALRLASAERGGGGARKPLEIEGEGEREEQ